MVGTPSLVRIGKFWASLLVLVGLRSVSSTALLGPAEAGESVMGNLKSVITSGLLRGESLAEPDPMAGVTGAVEAPDRPMDLSGGYDAWNKGD